MLTVLQVQKAKSKDKDYKLTHEKGVYLLVTKKGSKYWRMNYRFAGKRKTLALGVFPKVDKAEADSIAAAAREDLRSGIDPNLIKRNQKLGLITTNADTFESIARQWEQTHLADKSKSHKTRSKALLDNDLIPLLGRRPISEIEPVELLAVLRKIETRTVDMAHRARTLSGQIFRFGIQIGKVDRDPTTDLRGALKSKTKEHYAAIINPKPFAALLRAIDNYQGTNTVRNALKLAPMLMLRPGELRTMKWSNINWEKQQIEYSETEMKTKGRPHIVPLPDQALAIIKEHQMFSGNWDYVFPSARSPRRPLSDNGMRTALLTMGFDSSIQTVHGFRTSARTIMDEELGIAPHLLEHQLHHAVRDPNGRAYNRTSHLEARKAMLQTWADYLDGIKATL